MLHGLARKSKICKRQRTANEQILGLSVDVMRACLLLIGKSSSCCVVFMERFTMVPLAGNSAAAVRASRRAPQLGDRTPSGAARLRSVCLAALWASAARAVARHSCSAHICCARTSAWWCSRRHGASTPAST
eukprot:928058-Prymnesium_polylepis.1